jgi:hypothetical protein
MSFEFYMPIPVREFCFFDYENEIHTEMPESTQIQQLPTVEELTMEQFCYVDSSFEDECDWEELSRSIDEFRNRKLHIIRQQKQSKLHIIRPKQK